MNLSPEDKRSAPVPLYTCRLKAYIYVAPIAKNRETLPLEHYLHLHYQLRNQLYCLNPTISLNNAWVSYKTFYRGVHTNFQRRYIYLCLPPTHTYEDLSWSFISWSKHSPPTKDQNHEWPLLNFFTDCQLCCGRKGMLYLFSSLWSSWALYLQFLEWSSENLPKPLRNVLYVKDKGEIVCERSCQGYNCRGLNLVMGVL